MRCPSNSFTSGANFFLRSLCRGTEAEGGTDVAVKQPAHQKALKKQVSAKPAKILVTGDYVLDHHIYEGRRHHFGDRRNRGVHEVEELGGAALVRYLLRELGGGIESHLGVEIDEKRKPPRSVAARVPSSRSAYAFWRPFPREGDKSPENAVWRAAEAMGFGGLVAEKDHFRWPSAPALREKADVVVLSDGGMGFRDSRGFWPKTDLAKVRWIVLKTAAPLGAGRLWKHLTQASLRGKLVVIVSASELRKSTAQISEGLSWEATLETVLKALADGGVLEDLTLCRHLIIDFDTEGALWLERESPEDPARAHLVYRADAIEDTDRRMRKDSVFGSLSCLTAAVAWELARKQDHPDLEAALEGGLSAMYDLFDRGHGRAVEDGVGYPAKRLAQVISEATCRYSRAVFSENDVINPKTCKLPEAPADPVRCWSLMHEALRAQKQGCPDPAWALAELVALRGPIALGSLPHLSIGNLTSADREEIEALRVLRRLIQDYQAGGPRKKPLSIGVFGPPGAGKSFAVKEIAKALVGEEQWMEFNLSQFKDDIDTDDLIGAFHQIRDKALRGQVPVAFFDEFDSRDYHWLQYLLAPMQDGAFQQGQITHPIGKSIFVFAGGTSRTFASFGPPDGDERAFASFTMAKGPDFKSRLDGFLDVLGPNRRDLALLSPDRKRYEFKPDTCDIFYPVRRAFVIRGEFGCKPTDKLAIDTGLLQALLRVGKYRHGARSLSKVIEPLRADRPGHVRRSLIPPRQQLELHVDAHDFLAQCKDANTPHTIASFKPDVRENVAAAVHETWRKLGLEKGWITPKKKGDVNFSRLSVFLKASNRAAADRIPTTLALIKHTLANGKNTPEEIEQIRMKLEYHLELLAEAEHAGWMEWHLDQGWQYGPKKDEEKMTHPCLKPYLDLSDAERNKDRDAIRHYLDFAKAAGMKIVLTAKP